MSENVAVSASYWMTMQRLRDVRVLLTGCILSTTPGRDERRREREVAGGVDDRRTGEALGRLGGLLEDRHGDLARAVQPAAAVVTMSLSPRLSM
jgi:hypothetical protein